MNARPTLLAIGEITKAFGIKGEVVVRSLTDSIQRFRKLTTVHLGLTDTTATIVPVKGVKLGTKGVRLLLEGITDRAQAERIVGQLLFVDEESRVALPRGRYFVHEVIGMVVVNEEGTKLGTLTDVLKMPASDIYVVDVNGKEVMIPAVKQFVRKMDMRTGQIVVRLIDGMVDANEN